MDSIEILVEVEKTFVINIPDVEAEKIITVGDFHNTVWKHLAGKHSEKCKSQHLFYLLRKNFNEAFNLEPMHFKLNTSPEEIFPKTSRRNIYLNFEKKINLQLPSLVLTKPWDNLLFTFGCITIVGSLILSLVLIFFYDYSKWLLLLSVAGGIVSLFVSELLNPKRIIVEQNTIRAFIERLLALNYKTLLVNEGVNRKEMELVINNIIADKAGLELEEISPEKSIANDFGID